MVVIRHMILNKRWVRLGMNASHSGSTLPYSEPSLRHKWVVAPVTGENKRPQKLKRQKQKYQHPCVVCKLRHRTTRGQKVMLQGH